MFSIHHNARLRRQSSTHTQTADIALGKPATQSSTFSIGDMGEYGVHIDEEDKNALVSKVGPERAVDGLMSTFLKDGSCAYTSQDQDPWWRVDLQEEHIVTDVSVVAASGECAHGQTLVSGHCTKNLG